MVIKTTLILQALNAPKYKQLQYDIRVLNTWQT